MRELLRDMWEAYQIVREERQFAGIQRAARGQARAENLEIQSEEDVDRILHQK